MTQENKPELQTGKNPREIEAAIGDTRSALTDDIRALSDKASPAHIKQEAKQAIKNVKDNVVEKAAEKSVEVKDRALEIKDLAVEKANEAKEIAVEKAHEASEAISEAVDEVAERTRDVTQVAWQFTVDNAVPLGLIGLGAGLLIANSRGQSTRVVRPDIEWGDELDASDYPADNLAFATDAYPAPAGGRSVTAPRRRTKANALKKAGTRLRDNTRSAYDKAEHGLVETEHRLSDSAVSARDMVQDRLQRVSRASRDFAQANPLALAFGTLLAGVGVGLLLPSTPREERLLRPARTRIRGAIGTARDAADEVTQTAKRTAQETLARATDTTSTSARS
jgi:gas vesicle protein